MLVFRKILRTVDLIEECEFSNKWGIRVLIHSKKKEQRF